MQAVLCRHTLPGETAANGCPAGKLLTAMPPDWGGPDSSTSNGSAPRQAPQIQSNSHAGGEASLPALGLSQPWRLRQLLCLASTAGAWQSQ